MLDFIQESNVYGVVVPGMHIFWGLEVFSERELFISFATVLLRQHFVFNILNNYLHFFLANHALDQDNKLHHYIRAKISIEF